MSQDADQQPWCLWHSEFGILLKGLTTEQLEAICQATSTSEVTSWFVWCNGWSEWRRVLEVTELSVLPKVRADLSPPTPNVVGAFVEKKIVARANEEKAQQQRRRNRFAVRYPVEIINAGRSFKSYSQDISGGGLRLVAPMPEWVAGYCSLVLTNPANGETIEFVATIVENQEVEDKTRFEFQPSESLVVLEQWLKVEKLSS